MAVEAGVGQGWERYVGAGGRVLSIERFGASAPYKVIFQKLGFTVENVVAQARSLLGPARKRGSAIRRPVRKATSTKRKGRK
jgi:hypothetical protein